MSFKLLNRVRMSLTGAAGTGDLTLNLATAGFTDFVTAGMTDGDTTPYVIEDGSPVGTVWEIGLGTYHSNGTISRDVVTMSSAGGTTKISVTANAILSGTFRGVDILGQGTGGGGGGAGTAPSVVQYLASEISATQAVFSGTPTPGNVIVAMGASPDSNGSQGFNFSLADFQYNQHSMTAWSVGWGYAVVTSANYARLRVPVLGNPGSTKFLWVAMEITGADIASFASSLGTLGSSSTTVQAAVAANSLGMFFVGGDGAADPSITAPSAFQVSDYSSGSYALKAGWNPVASSGNAGVTGSLASGSHGVLALNIPGL